MPPDPSLLAARRGKGSGSAGGCWIAERDVDGRETPGFPDRSFVLIAWCRYRFRVELGGVCAPRR